MTYEILLTITYIILLMIVSFWAGFNFSRLLAARAARRKRDQLIKLGLIALKDELTKRI